MRNYAIPDRDTRPDAGDTDALIGFFRRSRRIPRTAHSRGIGLVFLEAEPEEEQRSAAAPGSPTPPPSSRPRSPHCMSRARPPGTK